MVLARVRKSGDRNVTIADGLLINKKQAIAGLDFFHANYEIMFQL
jgi:hypothetical protein